MAKKVKEGHHRNKGFEMEVPRKAYWTKGQKGNSGHWTFGGQSKKKS